MTNHLSHVAIIHISQLSNPENQHGSILVFKHIPDWISQEATFQKLDPTRSGVFLKTYPTGSVI